MPYRRRSGRPGLVGRPKRCISGIRAGVLMGVRVTPAEVVLRMLLLKHTRNRSFAELEREVRANLVYRLPAHL